MTPSLALALAVSPSPSLFLNAFHLPVDVAAFMLIEAGSQADDADLTERWQIYNKKKKKA